MPGRKSAKDTGDRRNIVTVPLTPRANERINSWCDRTGGSKTRLVERLVEFWAGAPASVQGLMLRNVPDDLRAEVLERAAAYFASVVEIVTQPERVLPSGTTDRRENLGTPDEQRNSRSTPPAEAGEPRGEVIVPRPRKGNRK